MASNAAVSPSVRSATRLSEGTGLAARMVDGLVGASAGLVALALYVRTLLPTVGIGDTAEFQYALTTLTVPHPTGYPLYVFLGKAFTFLPFGNEAYRVNLLSAVCAAGAVGLAYLFARLVGVRPLPAAVGALAFAVAPAHWSWATIAEVYALHVLLVGLVFVLFALWAAGRVELWVAAFGLGLSFGNHRGMLLIVPALIALWLAVRRPRPRDLLTRHRPDWRVIAAFTLPWLLYLFIPIRGIPGYDGWWATLNYGASGSSLIAQIILMSRDPLASTRDYFFSMLPAQFGLLTPLAIAGLALLVAGIPRGGVFPARQAAILLGIGWAGILAFHLPVYGGDITGFMAPTFWMLAVCIGVAIEGLARGAAAVATWAGAARREAPVSAAVGAVLAALFFWIGPRTVGVANFPSQDLSGHVMHERRATQLLEALEPRTILVLNDDWLQIWQIKYQRYVAGVRPDTIVVDGEPEPILRAALAEGRPGYSMNYAPGLAAEGRLLPVLGFWRALDRPIEYGMRRTSDIVFGDAIELAGWSAITDTLQPGGVFPLQLEWRVLRDVTTDYVVFVHLLDAGERSPAGWDSQPLHAENPTSAWKAGERHLDPHGLLLPHDLQPGRYMVEVGLYPEGSTDRLTAKSPAGPAADRALLGPFRVGIGSQPVAPKTAVHASFGGAFTLLGFDRAEGVERGALPLTLYWRADRPMDRDYTVTVQLLDQHGRLAAQRDVQPRDGTYPTAIWRPSEVIPDVHRLPVSNVPPGDYRLIVAVYGPGGARLPVGGSDHVELGTVRLP
ncbi:MAG: hypothetical protein KatS3mg060_3137 [Dehalococcoidia bacterium]|nr:MAG: hypothetical protein KatS3mg060_3137 [Dehalococcoidia bacterium]